MSVATEDGSRPITAVQVFGQTACLWDGGIVSGVLKLPEWPFALAAALFLVLFAFALLANLAVAPKGIWRLHDAM